MAIIKCPECEAEISDVATTCPKCGYPIAKDFNKQNIDNKLENTKSKVHYNNVYSKITKDKKSKIVAISIPCIILLLIIITMVVKANQTAPLTDLWDLHYASEKSVIEVLGSDGEYGRDCIIYKDKGKYMGMTGDIWVKFDTQVVFGLSLYTVDSIEWIVETNNPKKTADKIEKALEKFAKKEGTMEKQNKYDFYVYRGPHYTIKPYDDCVLVIYK